MSRQQTQSLESLGEASFGRSERVSAELFALTYGTFVRQLIMDYEHGDAVNKQLDDIGYKMGIRLIDDFLSKSKIANCSSFADTADVMAKVAFKMFLGVSANVRHWSADKKSFSLVFAHNPLTEFVELPSDGDGSSSATASNASPTGNLAATLWYSNIMCGVIRGALEMVNMKVSCAFVKCKLKGDDQDEIRITLHEILVEQPPKGED